MTSQPPAPANGTGAVVEDHSTPTPRVHHWPGWANPALMLAFVAACVSWALVFSGKVEAQGATLQEVKATADAANTKAQKAETGIAVNDEAHSAIKAEVTAVKTEVTAVKSEVTGIKADVAAVKSDVAIQTVKLNEILRLLKEK